LKTIGLIGGTSWVSTQEYYRIINQETNKRLGGASSSKCVLYSVNFAEILDLQNKNDQKALYKLILNAGKSLIKAGAEGVALCANTMHRYAEPFQQDVGVPLIHIAEATAKQISLAGLNKVGLLGTGITMNLDTGITMNLDFYAKTLKSHGITTLVPNDKDRIYINSKIFDELVYDRFLPETKSGFLQIMNRLTEVGAEGIIMGCTEIPLLINQNDTDLKLFDTLEIHAKAIVDFSLGK